MFVLLPVKSETTLRRVPVANHVLIGINVLAFLALDIFGGAFGPGRAESLKFQLALTPTESGLLQYVTYQFLHGDLIHLAFNMLFLWVFGNAVNARMGQILYLVFYLAGGVFAGYVFSLSSQNPLVGASGSIAAVTAAYLVFLPRTDILVLYWLFLFIGTFHIQALYIIAIKLVLLDNILMPGLKHGDGVSHVAYSAHIGGYLFGFVLSCIFLLIRAVPRDQFDLVALVRRYYQRQQYRAAMADPQKHAEMTYGRIARPVSIASTESDELAAPEEPPDEIVKLRSAISERLVSGDYAGAAQHYEALDRLDPKQVLPRQNMLLVANQLVSMGRYNVAAEAYEKYIKAYPTDREVTQAKLMLGILYAKYLQQHDAAQRYLRECLNRLTHPDHIAQARHWLETIAGRSGHDPSPA